MVRLVLHVEVTPVTLARHGDVHRHRLRYCSYQLALLGGREDVCRVDGVYGLSRVIPGATTTTDDHLHVGDLALDHLSPIHILHLGGHRPHEVDDALEGGETRRPCGGCRRRARHGDDDADAPRYRLHLCATSPNGDGKMVMHTALPPSSRPSPPLPAHLFLTSRAAPEALGVPIWVARFATTSIAVDVDG